MREESFVFKMRAALHRQGVWGSRSARLLQEWTDHVREDVTHRVEEGADPVSAEAAAGRLEVQTNSLPMPRANSQREHGLGATHGWPDW
jgi:hypothetical protein